MFKSDNIFSCVEFQWWRDWQFKWCHAAIVKLREAYLRLKVGVSVVVTDEWQALYI